MHEFFDSVAPLHSKRHHYQRTIKLWYPLWIPISPQEAASAAHNTWAHWADERLGHRARLDDQTQAVDTLDGKTLGNRQRLLRDSQEIGALSATKTQAFSYRDRYEGVLRFLVNGPVWLRKKACYFIWLCRNPENDEAGDWNSKSKEEGCKRISERACHSEAVEKYSAWNADCMFFCAILTPSRLERQWRRAWKLDVADYQEKLRWTDPSITQSDVRESSQLWYR